MRPPVITTDFIARGGEALKYAEADNGGGDLNIIAQGSPRNL